ncbi:MAG: NADH-quinone oxidoreductase subunit H [Candidatus Magasanikbacteria bacterium]|nr:NADH-quinone oxidoreductase subunit H [Candidatus Magasanikbacteria bacterium]
MITFAWILQLIFVPMLSPLCIGIIRKIKAILQNRQGAPIVQPYTDIWKLLHKDEVVSSDASWIFRYAPFVVFGVTILVGASIPLFASFLQNTLTSDLLLIVYSLALGTFFLALAGMDTGSAFGGFASSREMTVSALAEGGFILALLTISLIAGTTNLFAISNAEILHTGKLFLPVVLAFTGFCIVLLAETGRFPFDNPATHLELTMIHEAMILEYSGKRLALMEWAAANKFLIFAALGANLFFPYGIGEHPTIEAITVGIVALMLKTLGFCLGIGIIESSMAKFRFFRLPDLLITSVILSAVAIGLIQIL